jgi:hypothetical protein
MTKHTDTSRSGHPIEEFLCLVLAELKGLTGAPAWSMDEATTARVVKMSARVAAGVAEVEARGIGQAEALGLPGAAQCRGVAAWLRKATHVTGRTASAKAKLAASLTVHEASRTAMSRGEVHGEQVGSIARVLSDLGDDVSAHDKNRAETFLLEQATDHDADDLFGLGREIAIRLDPDGADAKEAAALERQEQRARTRTRLSMYDDDEGTTHGRFTIPVFQGAMLRKMVAAIAAPKSVRGTQGAGSYDWQTETPHKLGIAFMSFIERFPVKKLPKIGGLNATVIAIGDYEILEGKLKAARLDMGPKISHTEFLRLACEAGIIPMWMDANGKVLASGRNERFHTEEQRIAAIVEQVHCKHDSGCTVPGYLCHLHHRHPWSRGGETSLREAQLLCPFHHGLTHADTSPQSYPMRT